MSVQAMAWALKQRIVSDPGARHVLLCLCNYADDAGRGAFPSSQTLADDTGYSRRSVQRKLDDLVAAGVIVPGNQALAAVYIERGDRRPVVYDVLMEPAQRGDAQTPRSERGDKFDANGVTSVRERGDTVSPNPSVNHQVNQEQGVSAKPKGRAKKLALPDWLEPEAWDDWHAYRNSRKGWTQRARELSLARLARLHSEGHDPRAVIEQSIERGWTGLFPLKEDRTHATTRPSSAFERVQANIDRNRRERGEPIEGEAVRLTG